MNGDHFLDANRPFLAALRERLRRLANDDQEWNTWGSRWLIQVLFGAVTCTGDELPDHFEDHPSTRSDVAPGVGELDLVTSSLECGSCAARPCQP